MQDWTFQEAGKSWSNLFNSALTGEPQRIVLEDKSEVVILAAVEYNRLRQIEASHIPSFSELLLEIPQDDKEFDRQSITPRDLDE